jgi:hypothetical protein
MHGHESSKDLEDREVEIQRVWMGRVYNSS